MKCRFVQVVGIESPYFDCELLFMFFADCVGADPQTGGKSIVNE